MRKRILMSAIAAGVALSFVCPCLADVPAPPVNQSIGMPDVEFASHSEADCRYCHDSGVQDRHHLLYDQPIPPDSIVPYPDSDGDGNPDTVYDCLNCHDASFTIERDCLVCHTTSPHHSTELAQSGDCVACHGSVVDNMDDGHYIPTYGSSLVTPTRSQGDGQPANSYGRYAGACDYCHDEDTFQPPLILTNQALHHGLDQCSWCHDFALPFDDQIRVCEGCHGPASLHNIQTDSPNPLNIGTIVVGGEDAGYGHVGRDGGPGDSDCWGCHGFSMAKTALVPGPTIPTIHGADHAAVGAGVDTAVTLSGSSFTNVAAGHAYRSVVSLTAADGSVTTVAPDRLDASSLEFTIPGRIAPGNYDVRAVKRGVASNPAVISVRPEVTIVEAEGRRTVTIRGSGFGGYAEGSGTAVTGSLAAVKGWHKTAPVMEAEIVSWNDTTIVARFPSSPSEVTVHSVFGTVRSRVGGDGDGGRKRP
jgi:hypothetical protein